MTRARKVEIFALALAVACLAWFLVSVRYWFGFSVGRCIVSGAGGCVMLDCEPAPVGRMAFVQAAPSAGVYWSGIATATGPFIILPLWGPLLLFATVAALAHRRARKPKAGTCAKCGYNLMGNVTGTCSECGTATRAATE